MRTSTDAVEAALSRLNRMSTVLRWTTPRDVDRHRRLVVALVERGEEQYPHPFDYPTVDGAAVIALCDEIDGLAAHSLPSESRSRVHEHVERMRRLVRALATRDDARWARAAVEFSGLPSPETVGVAATLTRSAPVEGSDDGSSIGAAAGTAAAAAAVAAAAAAAAAADAAADAGTAVEECDLRRGLVAALRAYGLERSWRVVESASMAAKVSVSGTTRTIRVREGLRLSPPRVRRLVVHEVGGHVLRWENARRQPDPLLAVPLGDGSPTEEGLAVLLEREFGLHDDAQLRVYGARVLAVEAAQSEGVIAVARRIAPIVGVRSAAEIAVRVKRGVRDPNAPGGLTKDHGYLSGLLMLERLDPRSIDLLRSCKWPADALPELSSRSAAGELEPPRWRPTGALINV